MGVIWMPYGCQIGARLVSDKCGMGARWVPDGFTQFKISVTQLTVTLTRTLIGPAAQDLSHPVTMDVRWVPDGYQMGAKWVSDGCQMGVGWVPNGCRMGSSPNPNLNPNPNPRPPRLTLTLTLVRLGLRERHTNTKPLTLMAYIA